MESACSALRSTPAWIWPVLLFLVILAAKLRACPPLSTRKVCSTEHGIFIGMALLLHDLHYALRVLRKSPVFTGVALVTLMLGIGANVVVFGVLYAILLRSLDVNDPSSLYQLRHQQWTMGKLITTSYPAFEDLRRRNHSFSDMAAINAYSSAELRWRNSVRNVIGHQVTGNYFDLLGVQPQLGRFFRAAEEHGPNSMPYLVLSDGLWRSGFQADPSVIGTTVELNR